MIQALCAILFIIIIFLVAACIRLFEVVDDLEDEGLDAIRYRALKEFLLSKGRFPSVGAGDDLDAVIDDIFFMEEL